MLIDGTDYTLKLSQSTLKCVQLIVSNYNPNNTRADDKMTCYSQKRETPLVLYNALNFQGQFCAKCQLLPIISKWVFQFFTWKFLKLQSTPQIPCSNNSNIWNVFYLEVHKKWLPRITSTSTKDQVLQSWIIEDNIDLH